ncbi:hypothetical protein QWT69_11230 [Sporosarcina oncorhynchi]|uniref:Uncharacterized protein n=1 Tax=Sporosarcina oncorhynchi TaxID=3056444 RepID=A0ABZ0L1I3_9BACL|nr:hypothetical protein [Sporosarcina sp. T2O-4]WOV86485.1 hypothetical protein QWT69_11230 [Sporosarcina sp. T2O-4]
MICKTYDRDYPRLQIASSSEVVTEKWIGSHPLMYVFAVLFFYQLAFLPY